VETNGFYGMFLDNPFINGDMVGMLSYLKNITKNLSPRVFDGDFEAFFIGKNGSHRD